MTLTDAGPVTRAGRGDSPLGGEEGEARPRGRLAGWMVTGIRGYQLARTGRPTGCRFTPTCSGYAIEAISRHGVVRGCALATRRLLRCRPWGGHGFDPVPSGGDPCTHP